MTNAVQIAYVCNHNKCDNCSYPECRHTTDIHHAKNFEQLECDSRGHGMYFEAEHNYTKFAREVVDMLMIFCDDDDQISIKVCELETNMKSILEEFI